MRRSGPLKVHVLPTTGPSAFKRAGSSLTLSTAATATDVIALRWDGTNWIEVSRSLNVS